MPRGAWPATLAPVRQVLDDGLDLDTVTVFVGENGAGKSTLVEAIALAFGMSPEGGSTNSGHSTRPSESDLWEHIALHREPGVDAEFGLVEWFLHVPRRTPRAPAGAGVPRAEPR